MLGTKNVKNDPQLSDATSYLSPESLIRQTVLNLGLALGLLA